MIRKNYKKGYFAFLGIFVIFSITVVVALSLSFLSFYRLKNTNLLEDIVQARKLADTCAETALELVRQGTAEPAGSLNLFGGSCTYSTTGEGVNKTIEAEATLDDVTKRVEITTSAISPEIIVDSWQEVESF